MGIGKDLLKMLAKKQAKPPKEKELLVKYEPKLTPSQQAKLDSLVAEDARRALSEEQKKRQEMTLVKYEPAAAKAKADEDDILDLVEREKQRRARFAKK